MGFQDFLIDSIAHNKTTSKEAIRKEAETTVKAVELKPTDSSNIINPVHDPLQNSAPTSPLNNIPSPVPVFKEEPLSQKNTTPVASPFDPLNSGSKVDPLAEIHEEKKTESFEKNTPESGSVDLNTNQKNPEEVTEKSADDQSEIPDWLKPLPKNSSKNLDDTQISKSEENNEPKTETTVTTDKSSIL